MKYFLDTYALIELIKGNPKYKRFINEELFTSILNLYELHYIILRDFSEEKAKEYFYEFFNFLMPLKPEHIFAASEFKFEHKKQNISYSDALGYAIAIKEGMKFLTGDNAFKSIKNVEFVK